MVRIFVTSNQISTVFCSTLAKKTHTINDTDILIIDNYFKKKSLIKLIYESSGIHLWNNVLNLSTEISNEFNLKPRLRQKLLRRLKHLPLIAQLYSILHKSYLKKKIARDVKIINQKLNEILGINHNTKVELFLLTQTSLNDGLISYFTKPVINYYEHGTVDYLYILKKEKKEKFYAVFGSAFYNFLEKRDISKNFKIIDYFEKDDMINAFAPFEFKFKDKIDALGNIDLILLDASEIFSVSNQFWIDYIEKCLSEIKNPDSHLVIIKPHPNQSNEVLHQIEKYCQTKENIILLTDPEIIMVSVERIYLSYAENVRYMFSTYSAAAFYLAEFFPEKTCFCFLYNFIKPYYSGGPKQYLDAFNELDPYIKEVFSNESCKFI